MFSWGPASTAWNQSQAPNRYVTLAFNSANNTVHEGLSGISRMGNTAQEGDLPSPTRQSTTPMVSWSLCEFSRDKVGVGKEPAIGLASNLPFSKTRMFT
jgi:hypothetical protein